MRAIHAFSVPAAHPSLPGHFPGRPIVPGVILLDAALGAVATEVDLPLPLHLLRVKFLTPVLPDEAVRVLLGEPDPERGTVAFACEVGGRRVLSAVARLEAVQRP